MQVTCGGSLQLRPRPDSANRGTRAEEKRKKEGRNKGYYVPLFFCKIPLTDALNLFFLFVFVLFE